MQDVKNLAILPNKMSAYSSPYDVKNSYSTLTGTLNGPVTASVVGHTILILLIIFGIPFVAKNPELIYEPIPVEIISSADLDKEKPPVEEAVEEPTPPPMKRQPPQMVEETPPAPEPEPVIEEAVPEPTPPPAPIETPESEVKEEPEPEKPIILPRRKPTPPPQKKAEKPEEKPQQENKMNALLKNLAESEPAPQPVVKEQAVEPTPRTGISGGQLSFSEIDAVRAQISSCWNFPAGAKYAENLIVQIKLVMNTNRTVQSASIVDQGKYNRDPAFRAAADAALRAVRNPRCDPLNLPPTKYDEWKTITLNFDPRGML